MQCNGATTRLGILIENKALSHASLALSSPNRPHKKAQETQLNGTTKPTIYGSKIDILLYENSTTWTMKKERIKVIGDSEHS